MKTLIYYNKKDLNPSGGPSGYLYNLKNEFDKKGIENISFLEINESFSKRLKNKVPSNFKKKIKKVLKIKEYKYIDDILTNKERISNIDLNQYDIIHFHTALSMYSVKDSLENYKGKIIYTSHCPKAAYKEIIEDYIPKSEYLSYKKEYDSLNILDEYCFNRADYIIFPCEDAEEPYYHTLGSYSKIHSNNKNKYIYIPTGIVPIDTSKFSRENIRKEYNIPNDAFVVCYVGRHNEVKGYDQLKLIANEVLKKNKNIYFLIAGKEEPIKGLDNERWVEVGWTNRAHEIIYSSDLFILPNKETYFDLILLEVMSIGKPVLLTYTGGNKYFKKFNKSGLHYYDYGDNSCAINEIIKLSNVKDLFKKGNLNKKLFLDNFTIENFTNSYLNVLEKIYNEKSK